jgi:hypothetical protein
MIIWFNHIQIIVLENQVEWIGFEGDREYGLAFGAMPQQAGL